MTNDTQLQIALAKMLPGKVGYEEIKDSAGKVCHTSVWWKHEKHPTKRTAIFPTEWEHIVRLAEETLTHSQKLEYIRLLHPKEISHSAILDDFEVAHASWQQRATAILKVKGVL